MTPSNLSTMTMSCSTTWVCSSYQATAATATTASESKPIRGSGTRPKLHPAANPKCRLSCESHVPISCSLPEQNVSAPDCPDASDAFCIFCRCHSLKWWVGLMQSCSQAVRHEHSWRGLDSISKIVDAEKFSAGYDPMCRKPICFL